MYISTYRPPPDNPEILVKARSNFHAYLWLVNTITQKRQFIGVFDPHLALAWNGNWIAILSNQSVVLIDPYTSRNIKIKIPQESDYIRSIALGHTVAAIASYIQDNEKNKIRLSVVNGLSYRGVCASISGIETENIYVSISYQITS